MNSINNWNFEERTQESILHNFVNVKARKGKKKYLKTNPVEIETLNDVIKHIEREKIEQHFVHTENNFWMNEEIDCDK